MRFKCFLSILILVPYISFADEIPVQLKADNLNFEETSGILYARGSVEAKFENLTIVADTIAIDTKSDLATAEGHLKISRGDYLGSARTITYDAKKESAIIQNFSASISASDVNGKIYLSAREMTDQKEKRVGLDGSGSTCEYLDPHYDLKASKFVYYPEDMIIGYNVTFNIRDIPIFWTPVYMYSLKKRRASLLFPLIGSNLVEGDFIKTTISYYLNDSGWGSIYLDSMSKKGFGKGIEHNYKIGRNDGSLYIYQINEQDTRIQSWAAKIRQNLYIKDTTKLSFGYEYLGIYAIYGGRFDQTSSNFSIDHKIDKNQLGLSYNRFDNRISNMDNYTLNSSHRHENTNTTFMYNNQLSKKIPRWNALTERLTYSTPIPFGNWSVGTSFNFYKTATDEGVVADERLDTQIDLTQSGNLYNLKISGSWYDDLDRGKYTLDNNIEYTEKKPEISLNLKTLDLKLFYLNSAFGAAKYHEVKYISQTAKLRDFESNRYSALLNAYQTIPINIIGTSLYLSGNLEQYSYDPGDQRYVKREHHTLNTNLFGFLKNNADYNRASADGNTPFFFDSTGANLHTITDMITLYYQNKYRFTLDGGYNYTTQKRFDLTGKLYLDPEKRLHIYMASGYDLENSRWRDWASNFNLIPYDRFNWSINTTYNLNIGKLMSASSILDFEVGNSWENSWRFRISHLYDVNSQKFEMKDLVITKDLHCWEATLAYSDFRKEYRISLKIKAFPSQPIGYVTGNQGAYFEGFFKDKIQQGSVQRY